MYKFKILDRKGQIDDFLETVVVLVLFIFLFIFIFVDTASQETSIQNKFLEEKEVIESNNDLIRFLRMEVNNKQIADILTEAYLKGDYSNIEQVGKDFFDPLYKTKTSSWKIVVKNNGKDVKEFNKALKGEGTKICEGTVKGKKIECSSILPVSNMDIPLPKGSLEIILYRSKIRPKIIISEDTEPKLA